MYQKVKMFPFIKLEPVSYLTYKTYFVNQVFDIQKFIEFILIKNNTLEIE